MTVYIILIVYANKTRGKVTCETLLLMKQWGILRNKKTSPPIREVKQKFLVKKVSGLKDSPHPGSSQTCLSPIQLNGPAVLGIVCWEFVVYVDTLPKGIVCIPPQPYSAIKLIPVSKLKFSLAVSQKITCVFYKNRNHHWLKQKSHK